MNSIINIQPITDKQTWETFLSDHPEANFLSSHNWGSFHQSLGKKVFFLGVYRRTSLVGVCLAVKETAKRGNYLTVAGGPILDWSQTEIAASIFSHLKSLAKQEGCLFVRIRPQIFDTPQNHSLFQSLGARISPMHLTADLTLQLGLDQSKDKLLSQMRKNTRYEIKKADKLKLKTVISKNPEDLKEFDHYQQLLAQKHGFVPFSHQFIYKQFLNFVSDDQVALIHSYQKDQLLASAFVIFYGSEAVYHYGISTPENQKLPGSYACQWTAINEAKDRGLRRYNFWGIAPTDAPQNHRFAGVSLFKRGFGGQEVAYLPAHDLPTSPLYWLTFAFEKLRARSRHLS